MSTAEDRVTVVVLTHDRPAELARCLARLAALPERPMVIVVDNASPHAEAFESVVQRAAPDLVVRNRRNRGAAGRNDGVALVSSPYVAFCDDDTWWAPGALTRAADLLDAHPRLAVVNARVLVEPGGRDDPASLAMNACPRGSEPLPGPPIVSFMAGAAVMRVAAYRAVGGYEPRFFLGAEETLMALDLAAAGWRLAYVHEVVLHHEPSPRRRVRAREVATLRNRLWVAWLRLPAAAAWRQTRAGLSQAARQRVLLPVAARAALGIPWVLWRRRVVPPRVAADWERVFGQALRG